MKTPLSVAKPEVFLENVVLGRLQMLPLELQMPARNRALDYLLIAQSFGQSAQVLRRDGFYLIGARLVKTFLLSQNVCFL